MKFLTLPLTKKERGAKTYSNMKNIIYETPENCHWLSKLRFPVQNPLGARPGLGTQSRYEAPSDLHVKHVQTQ